MAKKDRTNKQNKDKYGTGGINIDEWIEGRMQMKIYN